MEPNIGRPLFDSARCCFVLNDVPMFRQQAILDGYDVGNDPTPRQPMTRKTPVQNDVVAFRYNDPWLVSQRARKCPCQIKQAVPSRRDVSTML